MTTALAQGVTAAPERFVHFHCGKCGVDVQIKPADDSDRVILYRQPTQDDLDTLTSFDGPGCPMCQHWRGGYYPLLRVLAPGEHAAVDAFLASVYPCRLADAEEPPPEPADDADDAAVKAYDAWWDRIDAIGTQYQKTRARLITEFGYPSEWMIELEENEIKRAERAANAAKAVSA